MDIFCTKFHPHRSKKHVNYGCMVWLLLMKYSLASHRFEIFCTKFYENLKKVSVAVTRSQTDRREGNLIASFNKYRLSFVVKHHYYYFPCNSYNPGHSHWITPTQFECLTHTDDRHYPHPYKNDSSSRLSKHYHRSTATTGVSSLSWAE
jgi:hypothetical protein